MLRRLSDACESLVPSASFKLALASPSGAVSNSRIELGGEVVVTLTSGVDAGPVFGSIA